MVRARQGILFVVSAPSGAGKTTLLRRVISQLPGVNLSISYTTRAPRPGEQTGVDYFFVSRDQFMVMRQEGKFIEWAHVHEDFYGTPRANLETLHSGKDLILEIDTQGAKKIKETVDNAVFIFILTPSLEILEERLRDRGGDAEEVIRARLRNAQKELDQMMWYDYIVENSEIEKATEELASIIIKERCKTARILHEG